MAAEHNLMEYAPIGIMFLVAMGFAISQLLVTQLIGPRKRTATKLMPYECGKDPIGSARDRNSIKFYSVAVVFLLFDIEVLFIVPFAVAFTGLPIGAFIAILIFLLLLIEGLVWAWGKGCLQWQR